MAFGIGRDPGPDPGRDPGFRSRNRDPVRALSPTQELLASYCRQLKHLIIKASNKFIVIFQPVLYWFFTR